MENSLIKFLGDQLVMKVVRGLLLSPHPRHLRELAGTYQASVGGMSDVLRRLIEAGVVTESREGNRRCFTLCVSDVEREVLGELFAVYERVGIRERAQRYSKNAFKKLKGMDDALKFYKKVKAKNR